MESPWEGGGWAAYGRPGGSLSEGRCLEPGAAAGLLFARHLVFQGEGFPAPTSAVKGRGSDDERAGYFDFFVAVFVWATSTRAAVLSLPTSV